MEVVEGFICPACFKTLNSVHHLEAHFNSQHSSTKGNQQSGKQKNIPTVDIPYNIYKTDFWDTAEERVSRSHFNEFRKFRSNIAGPKAIESNKLLLRFRKLLFVTNSLSAVDSRKESEKTIVGWVPDEDVPLCPNCGKQFNLMLLRRKHHCRLCGSIMCSTCSSSISHYLARFVIEGIQVDEKALSDAFLQSLNIYIEGLPVPDSEISNQQDHVKVCLYCENIFKRICIDIYHKNNTSPVVHVYKRLVSHMDEVKSLRPKFLDAASSISKGESEYSFNETSEMRQQLLKNYEIIEALSKKISNFYADSDNYLNSEVRLVTAIRKAAQLFLQQNLYAIQSLPTREQYMMQREHRKTALVKKIERDKREAAAFFSKSNSPKLTPHGSPERAMQRSSVGSKSQGWLPSAVKTSTAEDTSDPLLAQIRQVEGYLKQAESAGRLDEVQILSENLQQLRSCVMY